MALPAREEWDRICKERKTRRNLQRRQRELCRKMLRGRTKFRQDPDLQTELRRVAALCSKLGERLHHDLAEELARKVMES